MSSLAAILLLYGSVMMICRGDSSPCRYHPSYRYRPPYRFTWGVGPGYWSRVRRSLLVTAVWAGITWGLIPLAVWLG